MTTHTTKKLTFFIGSLLASWSLSHGAILLTIDITNPSAVTITSTGNTSAITATSGASNFPIQLKNFFGSDPGTATTIASSTNLQGPSSGVTLDAALGGRSGPSQTTLLLRTGSGTAETFTAGQVAFTGAATFDLSSISGLLPTNGFSGNITADNAGSNIVGTYSVVPEPATYGIFLGAALLLFTSYRRRLHPRK